MTLMRAAASLPSISPITPTRSSPPSRKARVGGHEVELGAPALREAGERDQVDAGLLERGEVARAFARLVRRLHVEIVDALHGVRHRGPPRARARCRAPR